MGGKLVAALDVRPLQVGHARGHDFGEKGGKPNCAQAWEMVLAEAAKKMGLIGVQNEGVPRPWKAVLLGLHQDKGRPQNGP